MRRSRDATTDLRRAIDALPPRTRGAMLDGIRANPIVVGAYTDSHGGICPMLAAHRHGGRTTLLAFARAWDRYARADRVRRATRRELATLEAHLSASLLAADDLDLGAAIADHEALKRRPVPEPEPEPPTVPSGATDRTYPELIARRLSPRRPGRRVAAGPAARTAS